MNQVERPTFKSTPNSAPTNPRPQQLTPPHNPVLSLRQRRDRSIYATRCASGPYEVLDARLVFHASMIDVRSAHVARENACFCNEKETPARRYRLWL